LRIKDELPNQKESFSDIAYDRIFDDKIITFLATKDIKTAIKERNYFSNLSANSRGVMYNFQPFA